MPRVTTHKKSKAGKTYQCVARSCVVAADRDGDRSILPGDRFYQWSRRFGMSGSTYRQHMACGYPRPTQLSSRKTASVEEAVQDAEAEITKWTPVLGPDFGYDEGFEDVRSILEGVAGEASDIASEYEEGADAMPDSLQYSPTAEAMRDVAQRLQDWADDLTQWEPDEETPDLPEREDNEEEDEYEQRCTEALERWAEQVQASAIDVMNEMPEYEG